jgi:hypothetical protein
MQFHLELKKRNNYIGNLFNCRDHNTDIEEVKATRLKRIAGCKGVIFD